MQKGRIWSIIHSQGGVVLTLQMQRSPLVPRREGRFSLPQNVPSGEERSRRVCRIRELGRLGFLNAGETSERFQFTQRQGQLEKFAHRRCHFRCRSSRNFARHTSFVRVEALFLVRALSHSRLPSLCRDWELQVDGGAVSYCIG